MGANLEKEPNVERNVTTHRGRMILFFFLGLTALPLLPWACSMIPGRKTQPTRIEQSEQFYRSNVTNLTDALNGTELPHIKYTSVLVEDVAGPADPVYTGEGLLGLVQDTSKLIVRNNHISGYLVGGDLYDAGGYRVGTISSGANGRVIINNDNDVIGSIRTENGLEQILAPDATVIANIGERVAVVSDLERTHLKAIVDGYDFSRQNK